MALPFDSDHLPAVAALPLGQLCAQLHLALLHDQLEVHYQPVMDLDNELVVGFEALARWPHPECGLLNAGAFVPQAEACGLVRDLDDWVLQTVGRQVAEWQDDVLFGPGFRVAINMSGCEFVGEDPARRMEEMMRETGARPSCLGLELTETYGLGDLRAARRSIERLRELGVEVSLDDFGAAYATFDQLRLLPFDVLKLDAGITAASHTPIGGAFVAAAVELARGLSIGIVAEGIETPEAAERMRRAGCRRGQGFHWAPALAPAAATRLLETGRLATSCSN
jgi:EAL domain-containing protein (putative c-di-GMP-specific phosphodiesterase class I)